MEDLQLTILGSSSAVPMQKRNPTSQFLTISNRHFLIDCGEGTQLRLRENNIGFGRINHILISHLHGDHFYGLVPLLSSLHMLDRHATMHLYGPENLQELLELFLKASGTTLRFPIQYHYTSKKEKKLIFEDDALTVHSFPLKHSMPCCGFVFQEKPKPRNIRKDQILKHGIPVAEIKRIKQGASFCDIHGNEIPNKELTSTPKKSLSYAFCTDTLPLSNLNQYVANVDLLYHEATFTQEHKARAKKTKHSTAKQAAQVAQSVKAKNLLLGHFSIRYKELEVLLIEALEIFKNSHLAIEGRTFTLKSNSEELLVS